MKTKQRLFYFFFLICLHSSYAQLSSRTFMLDVNTDFHRGYGRFDGGGWGDDVKNNGVNIIAGIPLFDGRLWASAGFNSMNYANELPIDRDIKLQLKGSLKYYFLGWKNRLKFFAGLQHDQTSRNGNLFSEIKGLQYSLGGDYFFANNIFLNTSFFFQQKKYLDNRWSGFGMNASLQHFFERKEQQETKATEYYQGAYIFDVDSLGFYIGDLRINSRSIDPSMTFFIDARLDYMLLDQLSIGAHLNLRYARILDAWSDRSLRMSLGEYVRYYANTNYDNCKVYAEVGLEILRRGNKINVQSRQTFQVSYSGVVGFDIFLTPAVILDFQTGYRWGKREDFYRLQQEEVTLEINRFFFQSRMKYLF